MQDMPLILWCGPFSNDGDHALPADEVLAQLRRSGMTVARYDTERCRLIESADALSVGSEEDITTLHASDEDRSVIVVFHDTPDMLPRITVAGRVRFVAYPVLETSDVPYKWAAGSHCGRRGLGIV